MSLEALNPTCAWEGLEFWGLSPWFSGETGLTRVRCSLQV